MRFSILMFNSNQAYVLKFARYFLRIELENCHFAHICNFRPLADEGPTTSTQSIHLLKVYLVGYNFVADNTATGPFSFV